MTPFLDQNRPPKVKEIYRALEREHPDWSAEKKARIASSSYNKMLAKKADSAAEDITKATAGAAGGIYGYRNTKAFDPHSLFPGLPKGHTSRRVRLASGMLGASLATGLATLPFTAKRGVTRVVGKTKESAFDEEKRKSLGNRLLDAGPGIGAMLGAGAALAKPRSGGRTAKNVALSAATGAGIGWLPATLRDAHKNLRPEPMMKSSSFREYDYRGRALAHTMWDEIEKVAATAPKDTGTYRSILAMSKVAAAPAAADPAAQMGAAAGQPTDVSGTPVDEQQEMPTQPIVGHKAVSVGTTGAQGIPIVPAPPGYVFRPDLQQFVPDPSQPGWLNLQDATAATMNQQQAMAQSQMAEQQAAQQQAAQQQAMAQDPQAIQQQQQALAAQQQQLEAMQQQATAAQQGGGQPQQAGGAQQANTVQAPNTVGPANAKGGSAPKGVKIQIGK